MVLDFDGVLASNREEQVYQADPEPAERLELEKIARTIDIEASLYDTRYLRHMVYQRILHDLGEEIEPGPLLPLAREFSEAGIPYYVLTARSSPPAIARVLQFCEQHELRPQELFFVGRVGKGRQLHLIGRGDPERRIIYFEDSRRHVKNSTSLSYDPLTTVYVVWDNANASEAGRRLFAQALNRYRHARGGGAEHGKHKLPEQTRKGIGSSGSRRPAGT